MWNSLILREFSGEEIQTFKLKLIFYTLLDRGDNAPETMPHLQKKEVLPAENYYTGT